MPKTMPAEMVRNPGFLLRIWKDEDGIINEELRQGERLIMQGGNMMIASILLNQCYPIITGHLGIKYHQDSADDFASAAVYLQSIQNFYEKITGSTSILDEPIPPEAIIRDDILVKLPHLRAAFENSPTSVFRDEISDMCEIINSWFNPRIIKRYGVIPYSSLGTPFHELKNRTRALNFFTYRCEGLKTSPAYVYDRIVTQYRSDGLIALAWAEVWFGLEHMISVGVCPYCGKIYRIPPNAHTKASCGSKECSLQQRKDSSASKHGPGYETERKKLPKVQGRRSGRPLDPLAAKAIDFKKKGTDWDYRKEIKRIAKLLKVPEYQVNIWLKNHVKKLSKQGCSVEEISQQLKISPGSISDIISGLMRLRDEPL